MKTAEELANEFYLLADEHIMENRVLLYEETIKLLNIWKSSICKQQRKNCAETFREQIGLLIALIDRTEISGAIRATKEPE